MRLRLRGTVVVCALVLAIPVRARSLTEADEAALHNELELAALLRLALEHNPAIAEARANVAGSRARVEVNAQRPDPELTYEQWAVPLTRPWAISDGNMAMIGLKQTFPAPGSLPARRRAAESNVSIAASDLRTKELDLAAQVKQAFAEYVRADAELRIHREHVDVAHRLTEIARVQYASNRIAQEDVLRTSIEASRMHADVITAEQERRSAAALLNALLGRDPSAPLGRPKAVTTTAALTEAREATSARPEIAAAEHAVDRSLATLDVAQAERRWPMFMVGVDAVYDPMRPGAAYSAMLGMTLPWLNPGRSAGVRAAEADVAANQQALQAVTLTTRYQLADAAARMEAAQKSLAILDEQVLPQMQRVFDASRASFASGNASALGVLDSLRSLLQIQIDRHRAAARLAASIAAYERAAGIVSISNEPDRT